jgi:uridine kinase
MNRGELLDDLSSRISSVCRDHPVRVAVDGVDASGKTTLADELVAPLRRIGRSVIRASIDRFHNPAAVRHRRGPASAEGYYRDSFNYAALIGAVLQSLGPGGTRRYRRAVFDFRADSPVDAPLEEAPLDAVLLFDGVFLLRPELREHWDFSIFVHADFEVAVRRAEERDLALFGGTSNVRRRYEQRYVPGQRLYLSEVQPHRWASVVIDNNDPAHPRLVPESTES